MNYLIFDYSDYIEKSLGSFLLGSNVIHESSKKHRRIKSLGYMLLDVMPKRILDKMVDYVVEGKRSFNVIWAYNNSSL